VGTFEYMSPEQAEMNAFGVDTRSDIYALGVLLYELMTGTTPLERQRLREAAFDEIRRIIKEEEPQRPSVRLSTSGTLAKVAAARKTEPAKLSRLMRGVLDWVVMRCLEKDRSRRYDTASNLARDVERYLKDEPVEAGPPSTWYRVRKMARRNRRALSVAGVVAAVIVLGTGVSLRQAALTRAERDARLAEQKRHEEELAAAERQYALDRAIEAAFGGDLPKAHKAIVAAEAAGVAPDRVHWLHGLVHFQQGKLEDAIREFESSVALKPSVAAYAMSARAQFSETFFSGNAFRLHPVLAASKLSSMTPETAEDYLCRGFHTGPIDRAQSLSDLDKAVAMRDTPIARAFRASAEGRIAGDDGDPALTERALDDIRQAKLRLSDNKFVRLTSLGVHLHAASMYEETGQPDKRQAVLEEAGRDAREIEGIRNLGSVMSRVAYFASIGDENALLEELDRASRRPETSDLAAQYALALYERGRDAEALCVLNERLKPDNGAGQMLRIILWAGQAEVGPEKAYDRYREFARKREANGLKASPYEFYGLILLGKSKEAVDLADSMPPFVYGMRVSGSEAELLHSAGKYRINLCYAHYLIGLRRLADGDRPGAREHFRAAVENRSLASTTSPYARAYLARLKRDPEWPRWIPVKKN
jgi:tetratricopeptide (TPR) repeat protein